MNIAIVSGNLTKDPDIRNTSTGKPVCTFTLGVRRKFKDARGNNASDFLNVVCWQKTAELASTYLSKGRKCTVTGTIQNRSYDAKDGTKKYVTEIIAENLEFDVNRRIAGESAHEDDGQAYESRAYAAAPEPTTFNPKAGSQQRMGLYPQDDEDDELPF